LQERRVIGLCYICDEKFNPGHRCTTSRFLLLFDDSDTTLETVENAPTNTKFPNTIHFHLSPQALTDNTSPKTLKFTRTIHNLPVNPSPPLSVMVGNEAFIQCQGICPLVGISLQTSTFTIPFYLLPIEGADVVLGIE